MGLTRLDPTASDTQKESRELEQLWQELDTYLDYLVDVLCVNHSRTKLKFKAEKGSASVLNV